MHRLSLPNPVAPILRLLVHGWVPVGVIKDDRVCTRQVDADAAAPRAADEAEDALVVVEPVY